MKQYIVRFFVLSLFTLSLSAVIPDKKSHTVTLPQFGKLEYTMSQSGTQIIGTVSKPTSMKPFAHSQLPAAMSGLKKLVINNIEIVTPPERSEPIPGNVTLTIRGQINLLGKQLDASFTMKQINGGHEYDIVMRIPLPAGFSMGQLIHAVAGTSLGHLTLSGSEIVISSTALTESITVGGKKLQQKVSPGINVFGDIAHLSLGLLQPAFKNSILNKIAMDNARFAIQGLTSFDQLKKELPSMQLSGSVNLSKVTFKNVPLHLGSLDGTINLSANKLQTSLPIPSFSLPGFGSVSKASINISASIQPVKQTASVAMTLNGNVSASLPIIGSVQAKLDALYNSKTERFDIEAKIKKPEVLKPFEHAPIPGLKDLELRDLAIKTQTSGGKTTLVISGQSSLFNTPVQAELRTIRIGGTSQQVLTAIMPKAWSVTQAIPALKDTPLSNLSFESFAVVISPIDYMNTTLNTKILKGINLIGSMKSLSFKSLMPKLAASSLKSITFKDVDFVIQGIYSLTNFDKMQVSLNAKANLSEVPGLQQLGNLSSVPLSANFSKDGKLSMDFPVSTPNGKVTVSLDADPNAKTSAEKVSIGILTHQKLKLPMIGEVEFELEMDTDPKNLELRGKVIKPVTIKPFSYISGSPEVLKNTEMGQLEVSTKLKAGEAKKITVENAKISGVIQFLDTPVEAMLNPVRQSDGSYQLAVKVSVPPTLPGLPKAMYEPWKASKVIPSLAGKPLGDIVFKQATFVFTHFELDTTIRQFGVITKKTMYPLVNIFAEVEKLNAGIILPQLASTPLNDITLTDVAFSIQKVKDLDSLKKEIPSMHISGTGDFSAMSLPAGISIKKAYVSVDLSETRVAFDITVPGKGISLPGLGTLNNAHLSINVDFANGLKAAPTGFDFSIAGKLAIIPLNDVVVDAALKLPPRPKGTPMPRTFAELFKGIKLTDFVMVSLTPPNFDITKAIPALKSTPLANFPFPTMLISVVPPKMPAISGAALTGLTANIPIPDAPKGAALPKPPAIDSIVPGLNLGGELPKLNFAQMMPEFASTPLASIKLADLKIDMSGLSLADVKKIKAGNLPAIKIKALADLSSLPIKIPGVSSLGSVPLNIAMGKTGTLNMKANFKTASGLVELNITANPLTKKFSISTTIQQVIPVPSALKQFIDVDEIEVRVEAGASKTSAELSGIVVKPLTIKPLAKIPGVPAEFKDIEIGALQIRTKAGVSAANKISLDNAEISGLTKLKIGSYLDIQVYATLVIDKSASGYDVALKISTPPPHAALDLLQKYVFTKDPKAIAELSTPRKISEIIPSMKGVPLGDVIFSTLNIILTTKDLPATAFPDLHMAMTKGVNIIGTIATLEAGLLAPQFKQAPFNGVKLTDVKFVVQKLDDFENLGTKVPDITLTGDADFSKMNLPQITIDKGTFKATINQEKMTFNGSILHDIKVNPVVSNPSINVVAILGPNGLKSAPTEFDVTIDGTAKVNAPVLGDVGVAVESKVKVDPKTKKVNVAFEAGIAQPKSFPLSKLVPIAAGEMSDLSVQSSFVDGVYKMGLYGTVKAGKSNMKAEASTMKAPTGDMETVLKLTGSASIGDLLTPLANIPIVSDIKFNHIDLTAEKTPIGTAVNFSMGADLSGIPQLAKLGDVSNIPAAGKLGADKTFTFGGKIAGPSGPMTFIISVDLKTKKVSVEVGMHQTLTLPIIGKVEFAVKASADPNALGLEGKIIQPITIKPFQLIPGRSSLPPEIANLEIGNLKIKTKIAAGKKKPAKITIDNAEITGVVQFMNTPVETTLILRKIDGKYSLGVKMSIPPVDKGLPKAMYSPWKASNAIPALAGKPLGDIIFKQTTFVFTQFKFDTTIRQFGVVTKKTMYPLVNIFTEVEKLNAGIILPQLASTPLNDITLTDVAFSIQKIKDLDSLKKDLPPMHISGTGDFSAMSLPAGISINKASVSIDLSETRVAFDIAVPGKGISLPGLGVLNDAHLAVSVDFANGLKAIPTGFDFSVAGKLAIIPLNGMTVDATLKLPPRPKGTPMPKTFAELFKGIKLADFVIVALTPPDFDIAKALPALKSTPLANIPFPAMLLSVVPPKMPAISGPELADLTASLPTPDAPKGITPPKPPTMEAAFPGLNLGGELPKLTFAQMVPELASTPLGSIKFVDIKMDMSGLSLTDIKKIKPGNLPTIKIKATADLSSLPIKIPGVSSLGAVPINVTMDKTGIISMKANFKTASGLIDLDITANPITKKFSISTTIHQVIPVPSALKQFIDVDEIEIRVEAGASKTSAELSGIVIKPLTIKPLAKIPGVPAEFKDIEIGALQIRTKAGVSAANKISLDNAEISGLTKLKIGNYLDIQVYATLVIDKSTSGYDVALKISTPPPHVALELLEKYAFTKDPKAIAELSTPRKISEIIPSMKGVPLGDVVFSTLNIILTTKDLPATAFPDLHMAMTKGVNIIGTVATLDAGLLAPQFKQAPFNGVKLTDIKFVVQKLDDFKNLGTKVPNITLTGDADFSKMNLPQITIDKGTFKATIDQEKMTFNGSIPHDIKVNPVVSNPSINVVATLGPDGLKSAPTKFDVTIDGTAKVNAPVLGDVGVAVESKVNVDPKTKKVNVAFEAGIAQPKSFPLSKIVPIAEGEMTDLYVQSSFINGVYKMGLYGTVKAGTSKLKAEASTMKSPTGDMETVLKLTGTANIGDLLTPLAGIPLVSDIKFNEINLTVEKTSIGTAVDFSMGADLSGIPQLAKLGDVSNIPAAGKLGADKTLKFGGKIAGPTGPVTFVISVDLKTKKVSVEVGMHQTLTLPIIGKVEFAVKASADPNALGLEGKVIQPITIKPFQLIPGGSALPPEIANLEIGDLKIKTKIAAGKKKPAKITIDNAELTGVAQFMNTPVETTLVLRKIDGKYSLGVKMSIPPVDKGLPKAMYEPWKASKAIPALAGKPLGDILIKQLTVALTPFKFTTNVKRFGKNFDLEMLPIYNIIAEVDKLSPALIAPALAGTPLDAITLSDISILVQKIKDKEQLKTTVPNISVYAKADTSKITFLPLEMDTADVEFDITQTSLHVKLDVSGVDIKIPTGDGTNVRKFASIINGKLIFDLAFDKGFKAPPTKFGISIAGTFDIYPPINMKNVTGVLQLVKTPPPGASLADIFKDIKPKDFAFIALTPPNFGMSNMLSIVQGIAPSFKVPAQLSGILSKLPKPNLMLAYTPVPLSGPAVGGLMSGLPLPKAQLASLAALPNLTPAVNFGATIPLAKLNDFVPPALQSNPLLSGIKLKDIVLTGQKLDGKSIPTIGFSALSSISGIPMLPDMNNLPIDILFQEGITKFEINLGKELAIPGIDLGKIINPKLSIAIDLAKKPIGFTMMISGSSKLTLPTVNANMPLKGTVITVDVNLTVTEAGITIAGKVITPQSVKPFEAMNLPDQLSALKTVEISKLAMKANIALVSPITSGAKPDIKAITWTLSGETSITAPVVVDGAAEFTIIQTLKPESKTDIIMRVFPKTVDISKMVEGIPPISLDLDGSEVVINTAEYTDPNPAIGKLEPGVSLYGSYKKVKALQSIVLSDLVPELSSSPFASISINNGSILIKDMNDKDNVELNISGTMDLSKVPGLDIPMLGKIDLSNVIGRLTYTEKDGLRIEIEIDKTFDVAFQKANFGNFKDPRIVFTAIKDAKGTYTYTIQLLADGTIKIPMLGNFNVNAEFDFTKDGLQQKFILKNDFSYRGIHMKDPYVLLFETKIKQGFELHGLTVMQVYHGSDNNKVSFRKEQKIDSIFSFMKTTKDKAALREGGFFIAYSGKFLDATFEPFKSVAELAHLSDVPPEFEDIVLHDAMLGLHLAPKKQYGYVIGKADIYGLPAQAGFFAIRDYLGKKGVAVKTEFSTDAVKLQDLQAKVVPANIRKFFNTFVAPPVRNVLSKMPAQSLGVLTSNIQFTFHLGPEGINVFPTEGSMETEFNAGTNIFYTVDTSRLIQDFASVGTVNILGKKINIFNPNQLSNAMGPQVTVIENYGLALKAIGLQFVVDDTSFKYNIGKGYNLDPGPFMMAFNAEPGLALILGVGMETPGGSDIDFAGKAELTSSTDEGKESLFLALGLTMEGIWKQPFGLKWLSFGDVAGQVEADITQDAEEDAADEGAGSATDEVDGPGGSAAGGAAAVAEDALMQAVGFTGSLTLGELNDPLRKTGDFAVNFNSEEALEFLLLVRLWGKYGSADIARGIGYANEFGQFMLKWYEFLEKAAPAPPKGNRPKITPPVLSKADHYKRYQPADKKKTVKSIGGAMKTSKQAITAEAVSVKKQVDTIEKFAAKVTPGYVANVQKFMQDINIYLENMEFHYAADDIEIGDLWFDRGLTAQGILNLHGYQFGFKGFLNYDGLAFKAYGPTVDVLKVAQLTKRYPKLEDQIVITGMGPDGKYGTKDDGPVINAQLNLQGLPRFVLSGKISVKPLQLEGEGDVTFTLGSGYMFKVVGNLFGFGNVTYEAYFGHTDKGDLGIGAKLIFGVDILKRYLELIVDELKVAKFTGDVGSEAAQKALAAIEATVKPLEIQKASLEKQIAAKKAEIKKKKDAWKTGIDTTIANDKKQISALMPQVL